MSNSQPNPSVDNDADLYTWAVLTALHAVDPEDRAIVHRLRNTRPDFDVLVAQHEKMASDLAHNVAEPAPAELKTAIFSQLDDHEQSQPASVTPLRARSKAKPVAGVAHNRPSASVVTAFFGVAAASVLLIAGAFAWQTNLWPSKDKAETESTTEVNVAGGEISLERATNTDAGIVRLENIPAPEQGSAYQMWLVEENSSTSAGVMERSDIRPHMEATVDGLQQANRLMISVEPSGGSATPSDNQAASFRWHRSKRTRKEVRLGQVTHGNVTSHGILTHR